MKEGETSKGVTEKGPWVLRTKGEVLSPTFDGDPTGVDMTHSPRTEGSTAQVE